MKSRTDLVYNFWTQDSDIPSQLYSHNWNMIGVMVNFGSHCILEDKFLSATFSTSQSHWKKLATHIVCSFCGREYAIGCAPYFFHMLAAAENDFPLVELCNLEWRRLVLKH